ncbi:MAG: twin-arginine translocase TatA/TatE family subunit [Flavobacteriaceae bacterium]|nr:twin-arginine translocase TatA/TatE family subunit [Flavobacteriaceae bacterium]
MISQSIPMFISGAEIFFILFIVLLVFGADKVPEIARGLGKGMKQIKNATNDIKSEITKSAEKQGVDLDITKDFSRDLKEATKNVTKKVDSVRDEIEDGFGSVKRKL